MGCAGSVKDSIECWLLAPDPHDGLRVLLLHVPPVDDAPAGFWQPITGGREPATWAMVRQVLPAG